MQKRDLDIIYFRNRRETIAFIKAILFKPLHISNDVQPQPIFQILEAKGGVPERELYQVFNMGVGMTAIVAAEQAGAVLNFIRANKRKAWFIGEVIKGGGATRLVG